jgi:hypothetical protein
MTAAARLECGFIRVRLIEIETEWLLLRSGAAATVTLRMTAMGRERCTVHFNVRDAKTTPNVQYRLKATAPMDKTGPCGIGRLAAAFRWFVCPDVGRAASTVSVLWLFAESETCPRRNGEV